MHFAPPFTTSARLQTVLTRKFVQISFQSTTSNSEAADGNGDTSKPFGLAHAAISFDEAKLPEAVRNAFSFRPINHPDEIMVVELEK